MVIVDTSRLASFQDDYDIVIVACVQDRRTDRYNDPRVTISKPFSIHSPAPIAIEAPRSAEMNAAIAEVESADPTTAPQMWYEAALVPVGIDMIVIHSLADISKYHGQIKRVL